MQKQACNFIKKETVAQLFSCEFCEISKSTFSYRTSLLAASVNSLYNTVTKVFVFSYSNHLIANFVFKYFSYSKQINLKKHFLSKQSPEVFIL